MLWKAVETYKALSRRGPSNHRSVGGAGAGNVQQSVRRRGASRIWQAARAGSKQRHALCATSEHSNVYRAGLLTTLGHGMARTARSRWNAGTDYSEAQFSREPRHADA